MVACVYRFLQAVVNHPFHRVPIDLQRYSYPICYDIQADAAHYPPMDSVVHLSLSSDIFSSLQPSPPCGRRLPDGGCLSLGNRRLASGSIDPGDPPTHSPVDTDLTPCQVGTRNLLEEFPWQMN